MAERRGDYEVGYGKPPADARFRKGRSGNPRGRPRGSTDFATLIAAALAEPVIVVQNGRRRRITKREAVVAQLVNRSAQADARAIKMLLDLIRLTEPQALAPAPNATEQHERLRQNLLRRLACLAAATEMEGQEGKTELDGDAVADGPTS